MDFSYGIDSSIRGEKRQMRNTKHQTPNTYKTPTFKPQGAAVLWIGRFWFEGYLVFGVWCLVFCGPGECTAFI